jgi:hypothetical protein
LPIVEAASPRVEECFVDEDRVVDRVLDVDVVVAVVDEGNEEVDDARVEDGAAEDSVVVAAADSAGVVVTTGEEDISTETPAELENSPTTEGERRDGGRTGFGGGAC